MAPPSAAAGFAHDRRRCPLRPFWEQKTPIIQPLKLTNITSGRVQTGTAVSVALSMDGSYSSDDTVIDSITVKGKIGVGKSVLRRLKINGVPAGLTPGTYYLVVQV